MNKISNISCTSTLFLYTGMNGKTMDKTFLLQFSSSNFVGYDYLEVERGAE